MATQIDETILTQFERHLTQIALSPKTIASYLADIGLFMRWAGQSQPETFSVLQITPDQIRSYLGYLLHDLGRAPSTVNRHLQALKKYGAYIVATDLAPINPAEEIPQVQQDSLPAPRGLSAPQVDALLRATQQTRSAIAKRDLAILSLLVKAGLRVAEVVQLAADDVVFDYPGVHLTVLDSRGLDKREVPLTAEVCRHMKAYLLVRPATARSSHLFLSQEARAISTRTVQRVVSRCAKEADLPNVTAQLLRRTYALRLWQETSNLTLVSKRLGHKTTQITLRYLGV